MTDSELEVAKLRWQLERHQEDSANERAAFEGRLKAGAATFSKFKALLYGIGVSLVVAGASVIYKAGALTTTVEQQGTQILDLRAKVEDVAVKQIDLSSEIRRGLESNQKALRDMQTSIETKIDRSTARRTR